MQETWVWSLGWKDSLEKEMEMHSSVLAWEIPWAEEPGGYNPRGRKRVRHDSASTQQPQWWGNVLWPTPVLRRLVYPLCGSEYCPSWEADPVNLGKNMHFSLLGKVFDTYQLCHGDSVVQAVQVFIDFFPSISSISCWQRSIKTFFCGHRIVLFLQFCRCSFRVFEAVIRWTRAHDCLLSWWTGPFIFMIKISIFPLCPHSLSWCLFYLIVMQYCSFLLVFYARDICFHPLTFNLFLSFSKYFSYQQYRVGWVLFFKEIHSDTSN